MAKTDGPVTITEDDFPALLRRIAKDYGGINRMARRFGVDAGHLSRAASGKRPPAAKLLRLIGGRRKLVYEFSVANGGND